MLEWKIFKRRKYTVFLFPPILLPHHVAIVHVDFSLYIVIFTDCNAYYIFLLQMLLLLFLFLFIYFHSNCLNVNSFENFIFILFNSVLFAHQLKAMGNLFANRLLYSSARKYISILWCYVCVCVCVSIAIFQHEWKSIIFENELCAQFIAKAFLFLLYF